MNKLQYSANVNKTNMAQPEKKYGLIDPKKKLTVADVFKNDSDSNEDTPNKEKKTERGLKKQTVIDMNRALLEDPTVYQYDEVYDTMKKTDNDINKPKAERKTKYMDALMKTAEKRKKENERRTERLVQKEREAEGETFKDKEEFITSSYRKKLEENKIAEEEERKMEYIESVMDVAKQPDLGSFYRHLYKETVPELVQKNGEQPITQEIEGKGKASSSSSDSDSSSDSSSSDCSSSEEEIPKQEETKVIKTIEAKIKTLEDGEIQSASEEGKAKNIEKNDTSIKFGGSTRRDRSYRQRDSSYKDNEAPKTEKKDAANLKQRERHQNARDWDRERERVRERDRHDRGDRRSGPWRTDERIRNDRRNENRRRSRSRSNRDRDDSRRNVSKKDERRDKPDERKRKMEKSSPHRTVNDQKVERPKEDKKSSNNPANKLPLELENKENVEKQKNIWEKRTVGCVFDAALERHFQRKAAKRPIQV